ncbi:MAG: tetratricopeptide repeat protein [Anaerolineae bacterium]|nr:tetratricopeptide repeat protein [Anaerolineae bacterium]
MSFLRRVGRRWTMADRYLERGLYHLDKKKYEDALADLNAAIEHEPDNAELYATRGVIYAESDNEDYADYARDDLTYARYLDPKQWVAEYYLGMMSYHEEDYHEALRRFTAARDLAPLRPETYYYRALCYYKLDDVGTARIEMELARQLLDQEGDRRFREARRWLKIFEKEGKRLRSSQRSALPEVNWRTRPDLGPPRLGDGDSQ